MRGRTAPHAPSSSSSSVRPRAGVKNDSFPTIDAPIREHARRSEIGSFPGISCVERERRHHQQREDENTPRPPGGVEYFG
jgi:hypothetical protein